MKPAAVGVDGFTFDGLRHTFASLLIAQGARRGVRIRPARARQPHDPLAVYQLFDQARQIDESRDAL